MYMYNNIYALWGIMNFWSKVIDKRGRDMDNNHFWKFGLSDASKLQMN